MNRDFKVEDGELYGEYDGDFHKYSESSYSFCPMCGENLNPIVTHVGREDILNNCQPVIMVYDGKRYFRHPELPA